MGKNDFNKNGHHSAGNADHRAGSAIGGGGVAVYLNRRLRPRMMDVAMHLAGVTEDDLFYFRNKATVDRIGESLAGTTAIV